MIRRRRTKIVCTIGPATESRDTLNRLILRGADVIRLNMSHGTHEWHRDRIRMIRELADETNIPIAIIMDIQGPKIRTGNPGGENIILQAGDALTIHTDPASIDPTGSASGGGAGHAITVNYPFFDQEVCEGQMILIDDGLIRVQILKAGGGSVEAKVIIGGMLTDRRGVSVPGADFSTPSVTEKDTEDLMFGIGQGIDYIAISFVRTASDVSDLKQVIREQGANVPIIAKIETKKGLENFSEILKVADGIMVARGDLGVEIPIENVPMAQKMLIKESNAAGKPVITATQMLESMIRNATPTRAEVTDVANAILDGTDAIMLSGETTIGKYPIESIAMMDRIAKMTESSSQGRYLRTYADASAASLSIEQGIGHAVCQLAHDLGAAAIITTTYSGSTAGVVSMYRPETPIIAITPDKTTFCRLALVWGVAPLLIPPVTENTDEMVAASIQSAMDAGFVETGDRVVLTAGVPIFSAGTTNLIKAHVVGQQAGVPF